MSETAKTQGKELDALDLLDAIDNMTEVADCAITLIEDIRLHYFECAESRREEMIQDLCLSHRHVQLVLKSADFLLEKLRDIAAEATGHPSEPIQA